MDILNASPATVTNSLDELLEQGDHSGRPFNILVGSNMGNRTLLMSVPMAEFFGMSEVANRANLEANPNFQSEPIAQRRLDESHSKKLALFILKGLINAARSKRIKGGLTVPTALSAIERDIGSQPYIALQPLTTNIRNCQFGGEGLRYERNGGVITVFLSDKHVLWVIDGQHRRHAMQLVFDFLKYVRNTGKYPRKPALYVPTDDERRDPTTEELAVWSAAFEAARTDCTVVVETHLGLSSDQERQLFHDLNNLTKSVETSLVFQFDNSNPVNLFIKSDLIDNAVLKARIVDSDNPHDWHKDEGVISRKDLISVNALLFLNKTTISGAIPSDIHSKEDYACRFWAAVGSIPYWGEVGAKKHTVAAQPVVLKALAKLAYDFGYGRESDPANLERLFLAIENGTIDFSHDNAMWRYFELSEQEKLELFPGLRDAVTPSELGGNLDLGSFDETNNVMRFGAKHNDIQRHLGDIIRWNVGLPKRKALAKLQEEVAQKPEAE